MKKAANIALVLAGISLVVGVVSRLMVMPIPPGMHGLEAGAFLGFTNTCLLAAIAFLLLEKQGK